MKKTNFDRTWLLAGALCFVPASALISGCGGGSSNNGPATPTANNAFAGRYAGVYQGDVESGNLAFDIARDGKATVTVASPSLSKTFATSGNLDRDGKLSIVGSTQDSGTRVDYRVIGAFVSRDGALSGSGNIRLSAEGETLNASFTTKQTMATSAFVGNYRGVYTGDERGAFSFTVNADNTITANAVSPSAGNLKGDGLFDPATGRFLGLFGYKIDGEAQQAAYGGILKASGNAVRGNGGWSSSTDLEGDFTVAKR